MTNQIAIIEKFMQFGGQTTNVTNMRQATFYLGMICEEVAEMVQELREGQIDRSNDGMYSEAIAHLTHLANRLKAGELMGDVARANPEKLLDSMLDSGWVSNAAALSYSPNVQGAFDEVARANLDKFPGGVATRDANGKVMKPQGWREPNLVPFIDWSQCGLMLDRPDYVPRG